jgi:hypothetical protein
MFDIFEQPWTLLIVGIVVWFTLLLIHGDSRLWRQSHLIIFLAVAYAALDFLVKAGLFKISKTLTIIIQAALALAVTALLTLQIIHVIAVYKRRRWQWLLPIILIVAAFGLDWLVQTDLEKINAVINTAVKAVEEENPNAIEAIISDNYRDSYHNTKRDLMRHCRARLSEPLVEKNKKRAPIIEISSPKATLTLTVIIHFDKQSSVYQDIQRLIQTKSKINLQKQQDGRWLINRVEILEINMQRVNWRDIR